MRKVCVESPYKGKDWEKTEENMTYARSCKRDCLINYREAPFASHVSYIHKDILDDKNPEERKIGMEAGLTYANCTDASVFYVDRGLSQGMWEGLKHALKNNRRIEFRSLWDKDFLKEILSY